LALLQEPCPTLYHSLPQLQSQAAKVGTREEILTSNNTQKLESISPFCSSMFFAVSVPSERKISA